VNDSRALRGVCADGFTPEAYRPPLKRNGKNQTSIKYETQENAMAPTCQSKNVAPQHNLAKATTDDKPCLLGLCPASPKP
jgi:hypothetical protein